MCVWGGEARGLTCHDLHHVLPATRTTVTPRLYWLSVCSVVVRMTCEVRYKCSVTVSVTHAGAVQARECDRQRPSSF